MQVNRRTLRTLIRRAGGQQSLADDLRVHRTTIGRWLRSGVPKTGKGRAAFTRLVQSFDVVPGSTEDFSPEFLDLVKLSEQHDIENQAEDDAHREPFKLPSKKSFTRTRYARQTIARIQQKSWMRKLTPASLLQIIWWFDSQSKKVRRPRPHWQFGFMASSFSPFGFVDYYADFRIRGPQKGKQRSGPKLWIHQLEHPQSDSFVILYTIGSNRYRDKKHALADIVEKLTHELNALPPREIMIRATFIHNYEYRTPEQITRWEKTRRSIRQRERELEELEDFDL